MSAPTQQAIVNAITALIETGTKPEKFFAELQRRFPGATDSKIERCIDIADWEFRQRADHHATEAANLERLSVFFSDMPEGMTLLEAAKTKAAGGDAAVIAILSNFNSDATRLSVALTSAAAEAHPGWKLNPDGSIKRTSDDGPDTPDALVDWFQLTHPRQARDIERRALKDSSGDGGAP